MKKRDVSIRFSIIFSFCITIFLTVGIISGVLFWNWMESVHHTITEIEDDINDSILHEINELVQIPLENDEENYFLIQNGTINMQNPKERDAFFASIINSSSEEIYSISYGMENGNYYGARRNSDDKIEIYQSNSETKGHSYYYSVTDDLTAGAFIEDYGAFDPRTRDWYKAAKEKGVLTFAPLYKHFVKDDLVLSAAYPIYDKKGKLNGVLGTHITLTKLNEYLNHIIKKREGTAYIVELGTGNLVANSEEESNFKKLDDGDVKRIAIGELNNTPIIDAYKKYLKHMGDNFEIKKSAEKVHIKFTEYKEYGLEWLIITEIPESLFTNLVEKNIKVAALLLIIAVLISIFIYIQHTKIILNPVEHLIKMADRFSAGDLSKRAYVYRDDEIGKLARAFNNMADEIDKHIYNLEEKVKERTVEIEQTNQELKKRNEDIQLLLDSSAEGIFGINSDSICTFINTNGLKMLGFRRQEELVGKKILKYILNQNLEEETNLLKVFYTKEGVHEEDREFFRGDGFTFPVEYYSYPQYLDGDIIGAVVTFMDISERKQSRKDLIYALKQAESANKAKSQFLANMSHEIRTPMNGILGFLQILQETALSEEQSEFLQMIKSSTDSLLKIINDILDVSKIEAGRMEVELISFDIWLLIENTVTLFDAKAREKNLELNLQISTAVPRYVIGDTTKIKQIVGNLVSNAIKFTCRGEVFVEVSLIKDTDVSAELLFTVRDTGIGIAPNERKKLFLPFSQADSSLTRKYGGTGLGLIISKNYVEMMDGKISYTSEEGKGSLFYFNITIKKDNNEYVSEKVDYSAFTEKRILIIDENSMNRYIAKTYLEELGSLIWEAETPQKALGMIAHGEKTPFQVILADCTIVDNLFAEDKIKRLTRNNEIPVIGLSPVSMAFDSNQAFKNGITDYITKPFKRKELLGTVLTVLLNKLTMNPDTTILNNQQEIKDYSNLKILLAEDNEISQKFFINLLKLQDLNCDIVVNGQEAIIACIKKDYDIIFMDCQMPIMDGFEATEQIRQMEEKRKHTVIIALTAFAMMGDEEKCLEVGMDDYLSKPIHVAQFYETLNKYVSIPNHLDDRDNFNDTVRILMKDTGFSKEISEDLIYGFHKHAEEIILKIKALIRDENYIDVGIYIHQIKGSAGNIRANDIADCASEIEKEISAGNWDIIEVKLDKLIKLVNDLEKRATRIKQE